MNGSPVFAVRFPARVTLLAQLWVMLVMLCGLGMTTHAVAAERTKFDHLTTGFELIGQHRELPCESCHANAVFKGTPRDCSSCHGVGSAIKATAKQTTHIFSSDRCAACHTPLGWQPVFTVDHNETRGGCSSCHNNVQAQGQPPTHMVTSLECNVCHSSVSWHGVSMGMSANHIPVPAADGSNCALCHVDPADMSIAVMNHINITGNCAQCHAKGLSFQNMAPPTLVQPPDNHIQFGTAACEGCHSASNFVTFAITNKSPPMNHAVVSGLSCATCHATGLSFVGTPAVVTAPADHIPTSRSCDTCHSNSVFTSFSGTAMNHAGITSGCIQCHGAGLTFAGTPPVKTIPGNHIPVGTVACETCHSASNFTSFMFTNASGAAPPSMVHSAVSSTVCSTCHEAGRTFVGTPAIVTRPATKSGGQPHVSGGECSTCHFNTSSFKGATDYPSNHIPLPSGSSSTCTACHANVNDYAVYVMDHTQVPGTSCATCHASGLSFANMAPPVLKVPPSNHIPFGSAACEGCHSASNFTSFVLTNKSPPMNHAVVSSTSCATCHASGKTWVGTPATVVTPSNHIPIGTAACDACHSTSNFTTFAIANTSPAPMNHGAVSTMACSTCHGSSGGGYIAPVKMMPANHVPIGSAACEGCHLSSNVTTFAFSNVSGTAPASMVHTLVSSTTCSTCHEAGKSWVGTPATKLRPALKASGQAHVSGGECSDCHFNTTSFKGATDMPGNHIPLPAADAGNCALCHSNASDYSIYSMNHVNITNNCAQCHASGLSFANMAPPVLKVPPSNHIPFGTAACEGCHSASNFTSFVLTNKSPPMNHAVVSSLSCATCHASGKTWVGTPATVVTPGNHIPIGTAACDACHSASNFTTFAIANTSPSPMNHGAVSTMACSTCHGSTGGSYIAPVKMMPANHVPIGAAACDGCHLKTNLTTFAFVNASGTAPASMVHTLVSSTACSACHEAGKSWVGTPATKVRPALKANGQAHVAGGECSTCHFNTTSFKGATDLPSNHIPLPAADNNNCALCHTTPGNYSVATMNHVNITNNCAQCHAYGLSFANMAPPTLVQPPSGATGHIPSNPPNGTNNFACELCHSPTKFTSFAGTKMIHSVVRSMTCMSCHELGMKWKTNTGVRLWVRDEAGHHRGQDCGGSGCHSTRDRSAIRRTALQPSNKSAADAPIAPSLGNASALNGRLGVFDHRRVLGNDCVSCHNQLSATGKPAGHIATSNNCASCHTTLRWLPVLKVDHSQVQGSCVGCHNGSVARGKVPGHVASGNTCELCHTTNAWLPAHFDHAGTAASCQSCHDAVHAPGKPVNHIPTSAACSSCHGVLAWKPAKLDHSVLLTQCASCHNNVSATGIASVPGHMSTQRDCALCHRYPVWTDVTFKHVSVNYPGEHALSLSCAQCHTSNTDQIPWRAAADAGTCGGCHAPAFKAVAHPKTLTGINYIASELKNCTGACHVYKDDTLSVISKSLPGAYHKVSDAAFKH